MGDGGAEEVGGCGHEPRWHKRWRAASHRPRTALGWPRPSSDPWVQGAEAKCAWSSGPGEWCFVVAAPGRTDAATAQDTNAACVGVLQALELVVHTGWWSGTWLGASGWTGVSLPCWALGVG